MIDPFKLLPIIIQAIKWTVGPYMIIKVLSSFHRGLVTDYPHLLIVLPVLCVGLYLVLRDGHLLARYLLRINREQ